MRPKVAARFAQMRQVLTQLIAEGVREFDLELAMPAEHLAVAIDALADGIARQKLADPQAVPDELMGGVLSLLFAARDSPGERGPPAARSQPGLRRAAPRPPRAPPQRRLLWPDGIEAHGFAARGAGDGAGVRRTRAVRRVGDRARRATRSPTGLPVG